MKEELTDVEDAECRCAVQVNMLEVEHDGIHRCTLHQFVLWNQVIPDHTYLEDIRDGHKQESIHH